MKAAVSMAAVFALSSCGEIEPEPPVDEDGEPIELPEPYDRWLEIVEISPVPGELAREPSIAVRFNDYIEDDSFRSYAFGALSSGGVVARGDADYVMTDKTVVWRPWRPLEPGLRYTFQTTGAVESATGSPLLQPAEWPAYVASRDQEPTSATALPDARWDDVAPIFEGKCAECHRNPRAGLNPLTYESLQNAESQQTDLYLVRPADPADSYLMRKLLWDYADIEFVHQPPAWAGGEQLSREELLLIEGWIAGGARR
jgi:mono/diheme cytochrome c family protein